MYDYISNFLSDHTATPIVGEIELDMMKLGNRGMLQGSVLSHFLFNVAMIGLPKIYSELKAFNVAFTQEILRPGSPEAVTVALKTNCNRQPKQPKIM